MIALDTVEQMCAETFQLVGADTGCDGVARLIEVGRDLALTQRPHGHSGNGDMLEQDSGVARNSYCRVQVMALASERLQLRERLRAAIGLVEETLTERQRLVGTDDVTAGLARGHHQRLFARQPRGDCRRRSWTCC